MRAAAGLAVAAVLLSGCGVDRAAAAPSGSTTAAPSGSTTAAAGPTVTGAPGAGAPALASAPPISAHGYTGYLAPVSGSAPFVRYRVNLPQLRGGDAAVRHAFNGAMRASLADRTRGFDGPQQVTVAPGRTMVWDTSRVSFIGSGAVAGALILNTSVYRAAHPYNTVGTVVIDTGTAQPIALSELFTAPRAGYARLAAAVAQELARSTVGPGFPPDASAEALADWLPAENGITVYAAVTHAAGDFHPVTVAWSALDSVLAPGVRARFAA